MTKLLSFQQIKLSQVNSKASTQQLRAALRGKNRGERLVNRQAVFSELASQPRFPGQTLLEQRAVSGSVARDYILRYQEFQGFCHTNGMSLQSEIKLDEACCTFLNHMFMEGRDISEGSKVFASVLDAHPNFGGKQSLARSRRALQGWSKLDPGNTRPPLAWALIAKIGMMMLGHGKILEALAITLMFVCYLRPGEALLLLEEDLAKPGGGLQHFALNLHPADRQEESKVGLQDETIMIDSPVVPKLPPKVGVPTAEERMGPLPSGVGAASELCSSLSAETFRPLARSIDELSCPERGQEARERWQADSSLRRYEAHAGVAQEFQRLPAQTQAACSAAEARFPKELQRCCFQQRHRTRTNG